MKTLLKGKKINKGVTRMKKRRNYVDSRKSEKSGFHGTRKRCGVFDGKEEAEYGRCSVCGASLIWWSRTVLMPYSKIICGRFICSQSTCPSRRIK